MTRRGWLPLLALASLLLLPACRPTAPGPDPSTDPRRPPNVVLVLTDDLDASLVQFMPQVQAMQAEGASFTHYTVADSLCCPSRASLLTGQYPHTSTIFTNTAPDGGYARFAERGLEQQTYAVGLQQAGYRTGFLGKYLNGYDPEAGNDTPGSNVPPGWDDWHVAGNGYPEFDYVLNENGREVRYGHAPEDYLTDVLSARGTDFITQAAQAGRPFALEVATFTPHGPYVPAPRHADLYPDLKAPRSPAFNEADMSDKPPWLRDRPMLKPQQVTNLDRIYRLRAQSVRAIDDLIAGVRETLRATGQADNTYLLFTSDNGYHLGEHRLPAGKQTAYATDVALPLVVVGPTVRHGEVGALAQNVDLAPTLLDLAGAPPLSGADGRSLLPLLHETTPDDWRQAALVEHHGPNTRRDDPDRAPRKANPPTYRALTTDRLTYVEYADGEREYYDDVRDPNQLDNAYAGLSTAERTRLARSLAALASCHGPTACAVR